MGIIPCIYIFITKILLKNKKIYKILKIKKKKTVEQNIFIYFVNSLNKKAV
jgi:hypothetical protein